MNYETIKRNYERKLWTVDMVRIAVRKHIITEEQFEEITNEKF